MHPQANKLKIYLYSGFSLSLILAALYVVGFSTSFDRTVGYFDASLVTSIMHAVLALSILWMASLLVLMPRSGMLTGAPAMGGFSKKFVYIVTLAFVVSTYLHTQLIAASIVSVIGSVLGGVSVAYFGFTAIEPDSKFEKRSLLGYGVIGWTFLSIIDAYFNDYVTMNSPVKLLLIFSMVFVMLFQLQEQGYFVGRGRPRLYVVFGLLNVLISSSFAISYLFCTIAKIYSIPEFLPTAIVSLAHAVYTVGRLIDMCAVSDNAVTEPVTVTEEDVETVDNGEPAEPADEPDIPEDGESSADAPDADVANDTATGTPDTNSPAADTPADTPVVTSESAADSGDR